jgi:uncharacterized protein with HEPN domain
MSKSQKEWDHHVADILHSIDRIENAVKGVSYEAFESDEDIQDIVLRRFQIIGEAARKIPENVRGSHPTVPWQKMISMRNFIVHEYSYIDLKVVWDTVFLALPTLKSEILSAFPRG